MRILDTDVCVEILHDNQHVKARRRSMKGPVVTTWITVAELYYGAFKSANPDKNRALVADLVETLDVLTLDESAAEHFGRIRSDLERKGLRLEDADLLIAGVVLSRDAILVTGNLRHYHRISGLECEDWIRGEAPSSLGGQKA